jgi:hypothetical protein
MINPQPKRVPYRNKKITQAAKGEDCTVRAALICDSPDTTVFAHLNFEWSGKGIAQKADDCAGVFACHACHRLIDMREIDDRALLRAYYRTIRRLIDKGALS